MEMFIRDLYDKELSPSEQDIEKYYNEHRADFAHPVEVTARHILVSTEEEAQKALQRLKSGESFAKVAEDMSNDAASAAQGGKIGPFKKGDLVPDFEKAVFSLKTNELSGVVKTQFGYHVIQKLSEKALSPKSLEQSKADIKKIIEKGKFDAWMDAAKKKFNVSEKYELLDAVKPAPAPQMPLQMLGGQQQEK